MDIYFLNHNRLPVGWLWIEDEDFRAEQREWAAHVRDTRERHECGALREPREQIDNQREGRERPIPVLARKAAA
jgi:hypothetical protein